MPEASYSLIWTFKEATPAHTTAERLTINVHTLLRDMAALLYENLAFGFQRSPYELARISLEMPPAAGK